MEPSVSSQLDLSEKPARVLGRFASYPSATLSLDVRIFSANFCTPRMDTWSASFSHFLGVMSWIWKASKIVSGVFWRAIAFNFSISGFSDFDELNIIAFDKLGVDVELWFCDCCFSLAADAALAFLASWTVVFFSFFLSVSYCWVLEMLFIGPGLFDFALFIAKFRVPPASVSFDVTIGGLVEIAL